jgi:proteic killer suppression protein
MQTLRRHTRLRTGSLFDRLDKPGSCRFELNNALRHITSYVIVAPGVKTFKGKETETIWRGQRSRHLPQGVQQAARHKLRMIDNARTLDDLRVPPANRLERLRGDRAGQYSVRIYDQWRICFVWKQGDAFDVEIVDYH